MIPFGNELSPVILAALAVFLFIGWQYRTSDTNEFHTASRKVGVVRTCASIFTVLGAPHFVIFTTLSFFYGWWIIIFYLAAFLGLLVLTFLVRKIRIHKDEDVHTYADIADVVFGKFAATCLSAVGFLFTVGVVIVQIIVSGQIISGLTEMPYMLTALLLAGTVIGYLYWGGYRALLYTDVIQGFVMFTFTAILAYFILFPAATENDTVKLFREPTMPLFPFILLLFFGGLLAVTGAPEVWQRILTAGDDRKARISTFVSAFLMLIWGTFVVVIGNHIAGVLVTESPNLAFQTYVLSELSPAMIGIVIMLLIAAMISTADTELFAASIIARKEWNRLNRTHKADLDIAKSKIVIIVIGVLSAVGAIMFQHLVNFWQILLNLTYITAPLAFALVLDRGGAGKRARTRNFYVAFFVSVGAFVAIGIFSGNYFSWWAFTVIAPGVVYAFLPSETNQL